jgi:tRNA A37 threonylcarbamoyltransferase TsaD
MAGDVKVTLNPSAVRALLRSPEIQADLLARAERIAETAGPGMEASVKKGKNRARALVLTDTAEARRAEATSRRLSSSLQAGA